MTTYHEAIANEKAWEKQYRSRVKQLQELAPQASLADVLGLARNCEDEATFEKFLRVLAAK